MQNAKAIFIELLDYIIARRTAEQFKTSYKFPFLSKSVEFGYSQKNKLDASIQMKDIILGLRETQELEPYKDPLNTGRLVILFCKLIRVFPNFELHAFKAECTVQAKRAFASLIPN